ncbi:MAG: hypothetical protein ABSC71_22220 [Candidatus Acidiferrales bacterium]
MIPQILFVAGFVLCWTGLISPPIALALGLLFGFAFKHPFPTQTRVVTKYLLQGSVVGLGFGMNLHEVLVAGRSGFVYTALGMSRGAADSFTRRWASRLRWGWGFASDAR